MSQPGTEASSESYVPASVPPEAEIRNSKGKAVTPPVSAGPVADTHCHLDMLENPALALARAAAAQVDFVVTVVDPSENVGTYANLPSWEEGASHTLAAWSAQGAVSFSGRPMGELSVPHVRAIIGVHPHNASKWTPELEASMRHHAADLLTSAIGEIGLDYHYDYSPRNVQRDIFARQLQLAHEMGMPVSLHMREAHDDGLAILLKEGVPEAGCVLHCFNLDSETLAPFLDLSCFVAFGGPLTFKKSDDVRAAATTVPVDHLLTETDAPFMAPEPVRGTTCGPEHTIFTARRLFEVYRKAHQSLADEEIFGKMLFSNALRLFGQPDS